MLPEEALAERPAPPRAAPAAGDVAAVEVLRGLLRVTGTHGGDELSVSFRDGQLSVRAVTPGAAPVERALDPAEVGRVEVWGMDGDDRVAVTLAAELGIDVWVEGGGGDDTLHGSAGPDTLLGGAGDDDLHGHAGADFLAGGRGRDELFGGAGDDRLWGGRGRDGMVPGEGHDLVSGGADADSLDYFDSDVRVGVFPPHEREPDLGLTRHAGRWYGYGTVYVGPDGATRETDRFFADIEIVLGSDHDDHFYHNDFDIFTDGRKGRDGYEDRLLVDRIGFRGAEDFRFYAPDAFTSVSHVLDGDDLQFDFPDMV